MPAASPLGERGVALRRGENNVVPLIGDGFGWPSARREAAGVRLDRAGDGRIGQRAERRGARLERGLPLRQLLELAVELLLVEQLPAGDAVDLRPHLGDAVLVGELHRGLAGDQARQHVVVEGEIGGGDAGPAGHDHQRADADPERDRADAHLPGAMAERVVLARSRRGGRRSRRAWGAPAAERACRRVVVALVVGVVGELLRRVLGHPVMVTVVR